MATSAAVCPQSSFEMTLGGYDIAEYGLILPAHVGHRRVAVPGVTDLPEPQLPHSASSSHPHGTTRRKTHPGRPHRRVSAIYGHEMPAAGPRASSPTSKASRPHRSAVDSIVCTDHPISPCSWIPHASSPASTSATTVTV